VQKYGLTRRNSAPRSADQIAPVVDDKSRKLGNLRFVDRPL